MALNRKQRRLQEKQAKAQGLPQTVESAKILEQAILLNQSGEWEKAEPLYRQVLKKEPENPHANFYIGIIENENRINPEVALKHFLKIKKFFNGRSDFYNNLGVAYLRLGRYEEALKEFENAYEADPDNISIIENLITANFNNGNLEKSIELANAFLIDNPDSEIAKNALAAAYCNTGNFADAKTMLSELIEHHPDNMEYKYNLACAFRDGGEYAEAYDLLQKMMVADPTFARSFIVFGDVLIKDNRPVDAVPYFRAAIELDPDNPLPYGQIGHIQQQYFENEEAVKNFRKALSLTKRDEDKVSIMMNMGVSLSDIGQYKEAEKVVLAALKIKPDSACVHWNLSLLYHIMGKTKQAWQEGEWRWKCSSFTSPARLFPQKVWDGSSLKGKSILLHGEQGLGDEIRMAAMIPEVLDMGAEVTVECEPRLISVFERSFKGIKAIPHNYDPEYEKRMSGFDFQCPLGTLPMYLRPSIEDFDKKHPKSFIIPDPERVSFWKERLDKISDKPKIGIAWRSGKLDIKRSIYYATPDELGPIFSLKNDVEFINLQYGDDCHGELDEFKHLYGVAIHNWDDIDLKNDLEGAFALTANMDAVVGASTSPTDMAPAIGIETYIYVLNLEGYALLGAKRSPWYPLQHLYPKGERIDSWDKSTVKIVEDVRKKLNL